MATLLQSHESVLVGNWQLIDGRMVGDAVTKHIESLLGRSLSEVAASSSFWEKLYRDPRDKRLWELTFPQSETHGGGPPTLRQVTPQYAARKCGPLTFVGADREG